MAVVWNITRAADEAGAVASELEAAGLRARALPCIERQRLGWPPVPPGALLFLTSVAALPIPDDARRHPVAALTRVAAALRAQGHSVDVESDGGVVALANRLADALQAGANRDRARVLYPTSNLASGEPEHGEAVARLSRVADVACHAVYQVAPPAELARDLKILCAQSGVVFYSPSAVKHFFAAASGLPPPCAVVTFGASTLRAYQQARPQGWPQAVAHAREQPLADTLRRLS